MKKKICGKFNRNAHVIFCIDLACYHVVDLLWIVIVTMYTAVAIGIFLVSTACTVICGVASVRS